MHAHGSVNFQLQCSCCFKPNFSFVFFFIVDNPTRKAYEKRMKSSNGQAKKINVQQMYDFFSNSHFACFTIYQENKTCENR